MSKTFREALAEKAYLEDESRTVAAIFAMPEMEAIRKVLAIGGIDWMVGQNLPKSVIDWVMEGEK